MNNGRTTVYVCAACGRIANDRFQFKDSSCLSNAILVWEDSIKKGENGLATYAEAIKAGEAYEVDVTRHGVGQ